MEIREYAKPENLEQAYELLCKNRSNRLLGGCTFLNRTHLRINVAIDLAACGLDYIREDEAGVAIGAYTSLRAVETSPIVRQNFGEMLSQPLEHLVGVQLRNAITIGAHVASRFGFSDLIPTLLALHASVRFYHGGVKTLWAYMQEKKLEKDILVEILLPKEKRRGLVQMMRRSYSDYSIFCLAMSRAGTDWIIAGGIFPGRAKLAEKTMAKLRAGPVDPRDARDLAAQITAEYRFGSNYRGSADYRRALCQVFARRGIEVLTSGSACGIERQERNLGCAAG